MAERYAKENKDVELEIIDYWKRKDLVEKYGISVVPVIVVDGEIKVVGAPKSYEEFVEKIKRERKK
jgi:predicted DsbA family dithiol-disulfide isomerase